jgi:SPP1 gp7 family putative phage head morphogenesis protein
MALNPIPTSLNLELNKKNRAEKKKRVNPVRNPKGPEVKYRKWLQNIAKRLKADINEHLVPVLKRLQPEYVNDAYAKTLEQVFENLRRNYVDIGRNAAIVSSSFTEDVNQVNKQRFYKAMENAIGIDLNNVLQNEGLEDIMYATTKENVALIKTIPEEYFKQIEGVVFRGTVQGRDATSMIKQITKIGYSTEKRARLIARDQTSKLNSALNQQRSQNLGVEEYIWRTAGDERVRDSHKSKNGKTFRWDDPPKDTGHPGQDIECRCVAQSIIKV